MHSFELPAPAAEHLEKYVDLQGLYSLALVSHHYHDLFQPYVTNAKLALPLLDAAMNHDLATLKANYDQASNPENSGSTWKLLLAKTRGTQTHNGETFKSISVIQYATWAGDYARFDHPQHDSFLLNYVLALIPANQLHHVYAQIQVTMNMGTEKGPILAPYRRLQKTMTDAKPILERFEKESSPENNVKNYPALHDIAMNQVGTQQKLLPRFGLLWFCADKGWENIDELTLPADRKLMSRHYRQGLRPLDTNLLGTKFLLYRAWRTPNQRTLETTSFADPVLAEKQAEIFEHFIETQTNVLDAMMLRFAK